MSKGLSATPISALLPQGLATDPTIAAVSSPLDKILQEATARIADLALLSRINVLDGPILDHLAWQFHVDSWPAGLSLESKRATVLNAIRIHRRKGSVWAVREALRNLGYADAILTEGLPSLAHDGTAIHDGSESYSSGDMWALFSVALDLGESMGVSSQDTAEIVTTLLAAAPVRCHLKDVAYQVTVSDTVVIEEHAVTEVSVAADDTAAFGLCHDGRINHDQARLVETIASVHHDGAWRHDAEQIYSGQDKYRQWTVTGERYDNVRSAMLPGKIIHTATDAWITSAPLYDASGVHDGAASHGAAIAAARDVANFTMRRLVHHNGRYAHNATRRHAAIFSEALTA